MQRRLVVERIFTVALVAALLIGAPGLQTAGSSAADGTAPTGITAIRLVTAPDQASGEKILVELKDPDFPDQSALSLVWTADLSAWFPTWRIELHGDLVPDGAVTLGIAAPSAGHTYEAVLSYAYATGAVAVSVYDVGTERAVLTRDVRIQPSAQILHAGTGAEEIAWFQPVATRWATLVGPEDDFAFSWIAASYDEPVWVRIVTDGLDEGDFLLAVETEHGVRQIPLGPARDGETIYPVATEHLPLGSSRVRLQYVVDGQVAWTSRPEVFRIGSVTGSIETVRYDGEANEVELGLLLQGGEPLSGVEFAVEVAWHTMTFDARWGDYRQELHTRYTLPLDTVQIGSDKEFLATARVPVPEGEPGQWLAALTLTATPDVATRLTERDFKLSTVTGGILGREGAPEALRVCSYNILGFEGYPMQPTTTYLGGMEDVRRVNHYAHVLRTLDCDIIGIQEGHSVEMMKRIALTWNRNLVAFPSATRFPGGIFTAYPVLESRVFNHAGPANQREPFSRFAGAALLDVEGQRLWVVNFHAWPHEEEMRVAEANIIGRHIKELLNVSPNMIVLGDFNSSVGGPFDRVLRDLGLVNVMALSWIGIQPTVVGGQAAIDHIYVSPNLVEYVQSGRIHKGIGFDTSNPLGSGEWFNSDHLPVVVELLWP